MEEHTWVTDTSKHYHTPKYDYWLDRGSMSKNFPWKSDGISENLFYASVASAKTKANLISGREDWIEANNGNAWALWSANGANGKATGLWHKFNNFRENIWMAGDSGTRGVESQEPPEFDPIPGDTVSYDDV